MEHCFISLLYPTEEARIAHKDKGERPIISEKVCKELGLFELLSLKSASLFDFFSLDCDVLSYRQAMFEDLRQTSEIKETLLGILPVLRDIKELRALGEQTSADHSESYLYSITEIELYINLIDTLHRGFAPIFENLHSDAFKNLAKFVAKLVESDYYKELNENLKKLSAKLHEVKSITVGVNLDAQMRPSEAGVISVNADPFHSGTALDKILRLSFRRDSRTCIAPLTPFGKGETGNRKEALNYAFLSAIEEVYRSSVRGWRTVVGAYVLQNTDFLLALLPEIEFACKGAELCEKLTQKGYALTYPTLCPINEKAFEAKGLYNPDVALRIEGKIVANDFAFDDNGRIFVITGPNRGGKSVLTCAVGLAQTMAQLGLPVCASEIRLSPVDTVETHFPQGADDTIDKGRLGEECARLKDIFTSVSENSMVLLDESLSSTGALEATYIGADVLLGFAVAKVRGIFSTHLHDLAAMTDSINEKAKEKGGVAIDTMTAVIGEGGVPEAALLQPLHQ
ncbi:MAG: hypothetical protein J6V82_03395, partial [Clostridia bacterium]|nr:hypothetical protein [Clostridia bacterium]